jgi:glycosyltransferase involved in cell wall biosynthesis
MNRFTTGACHVARAACACCLHHYAECERGNAAGIASQAAQEHAHWVEFIAERQAAVRAAMKQVDVFIAPSRHMRDRFVVDGGVPRERMVLLGKQTAGACFCDTRALTSQLLPHADYGFDRDRLDGRTRTPSGEPFTFGFIGRHVPAKGVDQLITAFRGVSGDARLRIWGRPEGQLTAALRALAGNDARVEWRSE